MDEDSHLALMTQVVQASHLSYVTSFNRVPEACLASGKQIWEQTSPNNSSCYQEDTCLSRNN